MYIVHMYICTYSQWNKNHKNIVYLVCTLRMNQKAWRTFVYFCTVVACNSLALVNFMHRFTHLSHLPHVIIIFKCLLVLVNHIIKIIMTAIHLVHHLCHNIHTAIGAAVTENGNRQIKRILTERTHTHTHKRHRDAEEKAEVERKSPPH